MEIIATMGPSTANIKIMKDMINAGVTIWRKNLSHGNLEDHLNYIELARKTNTKIMLDTAGPEIRVKLQKEIEVEEGDVLVIGKDIDFTEKIKLKDQCSVMIDDGDILSVHCNGELKIQNKGVIKDNKRLNFPYTKVELPVLTKNDEEILKHVNYDYVALSFTQGIEDIEKVKSINPRTKIIAKIESHEGVENIDAILEHSDGVMVARGDLALEVPFYVVPAIQRYILEKARPQNKPVYIATQMLKSMVTAPMPTRAEANDVFTAVYTGAKGIMLSETATGENPAHIIKTAKQIIDTAEKFKEKGFLKTYQEIINETE